MIFENKILFKTQALHMQNNYFYKGGVFWGKNCQYKIVHDDRHVH